MNGLDPPFQPTGLPSTTCPTCRRTSYHPADVAARHCGLCGAYDGSGGGFPRLAWLMRGIASGKFNYRT